MSSLGFAPRRMDQEKPLKLAMQTLWLSGRVLPVGARLWVRHEFESAESSPVEVVYGFMLPRDATLRRFRISGDKFSVDSELRPTKEAWKAYEAGVAAGSLSTLVQQYRDGLANLNVGNVRPGEKIVVLLELLAGVELRDDGLRLRFPFTLAPSYHAQARAIEAEPGIGEMELPHEEFGDLILPRFVEDARGLHAVGFSLDVQAGEGVREIASPSHSLRVQTDHGRVTRVSLARESDLPNRDLVLDVRRQGDSSIVLSGVDHQGKGRFAAVVPSTQFGDKPAGPRNLVILIDRSGSMMGPPLAQAKKAIAACLAALDATDRFGLVAFNDSVEVFRKELSEVSKGSRADAVKFLEGIEAGGGTELGQGLKSAGEVLSHRKRADSSPADILAFTDGQVFATEPILALARSLGHRVHCLGIGSASQDRFFAHLADQTGGTSRFLTPNERVDLAAVELFAALGRPVARDVSVSISGGGKGRILPDPARTVFAGTPLLILGDASAEEPAEVKISWSNAELQRHMAIPVPLVSSPIADVLRLLHGSRLLSELETRNWQRLEAGTVEKREAARLHVRLAELSREYGLASSEMSLVAVVKRQGDREDEIPKTLVVPVGMPEATMFSAYFGGVADGAALCAPPRAAGSTFGRTHRFFGSPRKRSGVPQDLYCMDSLPLGEADDDSYAGSETEEDVLIALAAMLEPDGGMPGLAEEVRVANSLAALLFLVAQGNSATSGPFRIHVTKLLTFLESHRLDRLRKEYREIALTVIKWLSHGLEISGNWTAYATSLVGSSSLNEKSFWHDLTIAASKASEEQPE